MNKISIVFTTFLAFFMFQTAIAQKTINEINKIQICTGGVVNLKATYFPQPEYPNEAKEKNISGEVKVRITIDEQGNVESAKVCAGHPLLRFGAKEAAMKAKFQPTTLSGQPVKVSGIVIYNFAQDKLNQSEKEETSQRIFEPKAVLDGIINGSAINLEEPEYPTACRCAGFVFVQVIVDTIPGKVESAIAVSGNPLLKIASIEAVKKSTFYTHGHFRFENKKVVGFVVYRFGGVKWNNEDKFSLEARELFESYKKMDVKVLPLAAYSLDQTFIEKLKNSTIVQNEKANVKVILSNNSARILQKLKQIGFEISGNAKAKIVADKIEIRNLIKLAEIKEILKISS